ncbi:hypothetical protein Tco_0315012 [Tanacetum coccineum]
MSNKTTEAPEVSSLNRQGVNPSQVCIAKYPHGYSSRQPKSEAAESANRYPVQRLVKSTPAGYVRKSPHLVGQ